MKHSAKITLWLIGIFVITQLIGLGVLTAYIDIPTSVETQEVEWQPLPYDLERPVVENETTSFVPLFIAILIGTGLVLLIIKLNKAIILKIWFLIVIAVTLLFAFNAFLPTIISLMLGIGLAVWRTWWPNPYVHNISELFIYGGLAAIIVPLLNVVGAAIFLVLISIYDMIAVWKIKHMVSMAEFQTKNKTFAGLFIPYSKGKIVQQPSKKNKKSIPSPTKQSRVAVLGGGDVGFPLIFSGAVFKQLVLTLPLWAAFAQTLLVTTCATIALALLLIKGKPNTYYPAMPFISLGCAVGYLLVILV